MIQLVTHFNILAGILRVPSFQHEKCEELWPLSRRNSRQESWFNLWVMKYEFRDVYETLIWQSQADWTLIIPIFPALALTGVSDLVTTPLCLRGLVWSIMWCLTGSCNNHCIVSLVMIIINQSPQLLGVSPLCSLVSAGHSRHLLLLPCSGLIIRRCWPYIIRWTQRCHKSDCLSFKSPVTARQVPDTPPHPVCPHLISPIVKLFTTPTREGFYKINSQPYDDLPGCRYSDTLILPQKEYQIDAGMTCVHSSGANIEN